MWQVLVREEDRFFPKFASRGGRRQPGLRESPDRFRGQPPARLEADQRQAGFGVDLFLQLRGAFREDEFAGGADMGLEQVSAVRGAVLAGDDHVRVDLGLVVFKGDVADEGEEFELFLEITGNFILLGFPVEPGEFGVRESADGFEAAAGQTLLLRELLEGGRDFFAGVEDQDKGFGLLLNLLKAHSFLRHGRSPNRLAERNLELNTAAT